MTIGPATSLHDLALIVGTALDRSGVVAVLSGGGAAAYYAPEVNQSQDLDFILSFWSAMGTSEDCILELGFNRDGGGYSHPATRFTLEFPMGPLRIGNETLTAWNSIRAGDMALNVLTPTDCVRDRLAWFLFYQRVDYSALEQALAVATRHPVDLDKIRKWAQAGSVAGRYEVFEPRYQALRSA